MKQVKSSGCMPELDTHGMTGEIDSSIGSDEIAKGKHQHELVFEISWK